MTKTGKKRYICSFVKKDSNGISEPHVVVIAAHNSIIARAILCEKYNVVNNDIPKDHYYTNDIEGIKTIRLSDTNVYEGETENDSFNDNNS